MCRDFIQFNRIYRDLMGFYRDWYGVLHFEWKRYQHLGNARLGSSLFYRDLGLGSNRLHHKSSFQGSGDDATLEMFIRFRPCSLHGFEVWREEFQENKTKLDHRVGKPWFPKDFLMNQDDLFTTWKVMTMNPGPQADAPVIQKGVERLGRDGGCFPMFCSLETNGCVWKLLIWWGKGW